MTFASRDLLQRTRVTETLAASHPIRHLPRVIRFAILGSGSSGNSAIIECGDTRLMIDAGLSAKQLVLRLQHLGIQPADINGILLTHEHGDHIRGLRVLLNKHPLDVFTTPSTAHVVRETGVTGGNWKSFETGQTFTLGNAEIRSFAIQHDAVDPVGFVISDQQHRLGFVSDAGFVTQSMTENLRGLHGLFIEANYDDGLLAADTKRPWSIKQRISSRHGHLSNRQVGALLSEIAHPEMKHIVIGHLSSDCNHPDVATGHIRQCLTDALHSHITLGCASQDQSTGWIRL